MVEESELVRTLRNHKGLNDLQMWRMQDEAASHIAALEAKLAERVKVKALEWLSDGIWSKAYAPFGGIYRITEYSGMAKPFKLEASGFVGSSGHFELADEAKSAAQADYERRILSALEATPPTPKVTEEHRTLEFVARWCWRTDPPNANNKLTDAERLSVIKYHPAIKRLGEPHVELADRETLAAAQDEED